MIRPTCDAPSVLLTGKSEAAHLERNAVAAGRAAERKASGADESDATSQLEARLLEEAASTGDTHEQHCLSEWAAAVRRNGEIDTPVGLEEERFDFGKVDLGHVPFIRRCRIERTESIDRPPEAQPAVPKKLMPKTITGLLHKWPIKRINRQHIP